MGSGRPPVPSRRFLRPDGLLDIKSLSAEPCLTVSNRTAPVSKPPTMAEQPLSNLPGDVSYKIVGTTNSNNPAVRPP